MVYFGESSSFAFKLSSFLTRLFAVASISFWFVMPLILSLLGPAIPISAHWCLSKQ